MVSGSGKRIHQEPIQKRIKKAPFLYRRPSTQEKSPQTTPERVCLYSTRPAPFLQGGFIMQEHMTERETEEYGLYYEEALALYQRYRNDPFELLAAAYELGFLKGKQVKEAVA